MKIFLKIFWIFLFPTAVICQVSNIEGIVYWQETSLPVADADVHIVEADQHQKTDENGVFHLTDLPEGTYTLLITHPMQPKPTEISVETTLGNTTQVEISLGLLSKLETIIVEEKHFPPTGIRKDIRGSELLRIPGIANDALRGLTTLPGIGIPNDYLGILYIRGNAPSASLYYLDRTPLGYPFHWGGLLSTISSEIIEKIDIYPGGQGAEFGLDAQTVLDIHTRSNTEKRLRGKLNLNILYSQGLLEGKIGDSSYISASGCRSYLDFILGSIADNPTDTDQQFPYFSDYQFKIAHFIGAKHYLMLNAFAATDHFHVGLEDSEALGGSDSSAYFKNGFDGQGIHLLSNFTENLTSHLSITRSHNLLNLDFKAIVEERYSVGPHGKRQFLSADYFLYNLKTHVPVYMLREDISYRLTSTFELEPGLLLGWSPATSLVQSQFDGDQETLDYTIGEIAGETFFESITQATHDAFEYRFQRIEGYLQGRYDPLSFLSIVLGVRLDYLNATQQFSIQPRGSVNVGLPNGSSLRFAYGHYEQSPQPYQLFSESGNPTLKSSLTRHYIMELEHQLSALTEFKFAAYYKDTRKLVTADAVANYLNQGTAFVGGTEVFLKHRIRDKFFGWVSYAYTHAERRENLEVVYQPYLFNNTHIFSLVANYSFTSKLEIGTKWQYLSGTSGVPVSSIALVQDPVTNGMNPLLASTDEGVIVELTPYHRLDLRVSHKWDIMGLQLGGFLDILNVYNKKNTLKFIVEDVSLDVSTEVQKGTLDPNGVEFHQTSSHRVELGRSVFYAPQFPRLIYLGLTLEF